MLRSLVSSQARLLGARPFATTAVPMPALSPTMAKGNITRWRKKVGDQVSPGDILCEIETDKATLDFEMVEGGYVAKILLPDGTTDVDVGRPIALLVDKPEEIATVKDVAAAAPEASAGAAAPSKAPEHATSAAAATSAASTGGRIFASPLARKVAAENSVNLADVSKLNAAVPRIVAADVRAHMEKAPAPSIAAAITTTAAAAAAAPSTAFTDTTVSNIRKTIAARLLESKTTIPHYYLTVDVELDSMLALRQRLNAELLGRNQSAKLSVNDFVIKAASMACLQVPEANSSWMGQFIRTYSGVDMNVAVSTPNGLVAPVVLATHSKGLLEISAAVRELAQKAKDNKLTPADLSSGTFTISNLGMYGVDSFSAIINPPQSCILAVGQGRKKIVAVSADESAAAGTGQGALSYETRTVMSVTLSCDHRTVDGAVGAQWLQHFKRFMQDPVQMLL